MAERRCLDCGEKLKGRSDKKFCSDQCRNNYNNTLNRESNSLVRNVHSTLRRNRKILADLYDSGMKKIHVDALAVSGFNSSFFTHMVENDAGRVCKYCYEYGLHDPGNDYLELLYNPSIAEMQ